MATRSIPPDAAPPARRRPAALPALLAAAALLAGGCMSARLMTVAEDQETFSSAATYSRSFPAATIAEACEAARRALLSQGYLIVSEKADQVQGRKHFQPQGDVHVELELRIVCLPEGDGRSGALAFATALQDRYALKKSSISASLGLPRSARCRCRWRRATTRWCGWRAGRSPPRRSTSASSRSSSAICPTCRRSPPQRPLPLPRRPVAARRATTPKHRRNCASAASDAAAGRSVDSGGRPRVAPLPAVSPDMRPFGCRRRGRLPDRLPDA